MENAPPIVSTRTVTTRTGQEFSLQPLERDDLHALYTLNSNPDVWKHLPSGVHTNIEKSRFELDGAIREWSKIGISYWSIKTVDGEFVGTGGLRLVHNGSIWNLYYRISPRYQGQGLATQVATQALDLANSFKPEIPVVAYMMKTNPGSIRVAENIGMTRQWEGPDAGNPDTTAIRYIYANSELSSILLEALSND